MLTSLIIPNHIEKKRPILLSHKGLVSISMFISALILSFSLLTVKFDGVLGYATNINTNDLLKYTNEVRADKELKPLILNDQLSKAAKAKADDMIKDDYWAHISPKTGKEPWDFIVASGYDYFYAGENLAVDFSDSRSVVKAWYESPSHRENLLNKNYVEMGFAIVNGELRGRKTTLVVQMFGSPRNPKNLAKTPDPAKTEMSPTVSPTLMPAELPKPLQEAKLEINPEENPTPVENLFDKNEKIDTTLEKLSIGSVLNSSDIFNVSKYISILLGLFLTALFTIDGYYVRKYGILRISGHTIFHIALLVLVVAGIWYSNIGLIL